MILQDCRFTHSGHDVGFTVVADGPIRTMLYSIVDMGYLIGQCEVYYLDPSDTVKRVCVVERDGKRITTRFWDSQLNQLKEVHDPEHKQRMQIWFNSLHDRQVA